MMDRFRGLCELIRPHVEVGDLAVSDSEDEDDEFERRRQQADRAAELRQHDVAYQCLLDEKQDSEAKVEEAQGHMALVAQELLATAPVLQEHLSHGERGELFSRWTHLISAANVQNHSPTVADALWALREQQEQAQQNARQMGLIAAQRMGTRKLKQLRAAGQLRAEEARALAAEEIQRHARGRLMRRSYRDMLEAHRKTLADAGTLELLGPMSEEVQQLLFSLQLIRLEIEKLESRLAVLPDTTVLGDITVLQPLDTLVAWTNWQLNAAGSKLRLRQWASDLYDCEILATLCDKIGGAAGCIAHQTSLLSDSKGQKSKKAKKESSKQAGTGRKSVRKEVETRVAAADRAGIMSRHLAGWTDAQGRSAGVLIRPAQILHRSGAPKLQFCVARMFLLKAALPALGGTVEWSRRIDELRKEWQELKAQADGIRAARNGWCSRTALANMSRLAADLDGTVAAARQTARQKKQEWDNMTFQMEAFARQLARGDEEREVADDGAEDSSEPTQLLGSQLHAELQEGLSLVSERLWGTTREQHAREVGRVGVLLWGTQCFLFQCFRHYLSKATVGRATMTADDWSSFVADCRIPSALEKRAKVRGDVIFDHFQSLEARKPGGGRCSSPHGFSLTFAEFAIAVVELAGRVMGADLADAADKLLSVRLQEFQESYVSAHVPRSDFAALGAAVDNATARSWFRDNKKALQKVYALFAAADGKDKEDGHLETINIKEFEAFIKTCKLDMNALRCSMLFAELQGLCATAQQSERVELAIADTAAKLAVGSRSLRAPAHRAMAFRVCAAEDATLGGRAAKPGDPLRLEVGTELKFDDFCLGICALALSRYPDAMQPMHLKLASFYGSELAAARKLKKAPAIK